MRKRLVIMLTVLALAAAALAGEPEKKEEVPSAAEERIAGGYILTEYGGGIGVYLDGELVLTAEADVDGLRTGDRELLRQGIEAASYEEVLGLIEDFNS